MCVIQRPSPGRLDRHLGRPGGTACAAGTIGGGAARSALSRPAVVWGGEPEERPWATHGHGAMEPPS
jgi:hypothetical protein